MANNFHFDADKLIAGLQGLQPKFSAALDVYSETAAEKLQSEAQINAPWTDRTGHARQRLKGTSERGADGYVLSLAHGVDYGIYLEYAHEEAYAIIDPTITTEGPKIIEGLEHLLEKVK